MKNIEELIDIVVSETMGIYPAGSIINGVIIERNDYENGWNSSVMKEPFDKDASEQWIKGYHDQQAEEKQRKQLCQEWIKNLPKHIKNSILELLENEDIWEVISRKETYDW